MKNNDILVAVIGVAAGAYILEHFGKSNSVAYQASTDEFACGTCSKSHGGYICSSCLDVTQGSGTVYPSTTPQPSISYPNDIDIYRQKERDAQRREEEKTKRLEQLLKEQQQHPTTHPSTPPHDKATPVTHPSTTPVHTTQHPTKLLGYGEGPMSIETTGLYGLYDDEGFGESGDMGGGYGKSGGGY